jgi:hypothetical protein
MTLVNIASGYTRTGIFCVATKRDDLDHKSNAFRQLQTRGNGYQNKKQQHELNHDRERRADLDREKKELTLIK